MSVGMDSQCTTCINWGKVGGGDWVPYGIGNAQLPYEYGCKEDESGELEKLAFEFKCPKYHECPKCPKHPDQYITADGGCAECEAEAWMNISDTAFQRRD